MSGVWLLSYIILWVLFLVLAYAFLSVLRNLGELADAVKRLTAPRDTLTLVPGNVAPVLALQTLDGQAFSSSNVNEHSTTFAIISPGCGPCQTFISSLGQDARLDVFPTTTRRVIISTAPVLETRSSLEGLIPSDVVVAIDTDNQAAQQWGARSTPTFVELDERGRYVRHSVGFSAPAQSTGVLEGQPQPH